MEVLSYHPVHFIEEDLFDIMTTSDPSLGSPHLEEQLSAGGDYLGGSLLASGGITASEIALANAAAAEIFGSFAQSHLQETSNVIPVYLPAANPQSQTRSGVASENASAAFNREQRNFEAPKAAGPTVVVEQEQGSSSKRAQRRASSDSEDSSKNSPKRRKQSSQRDPVPGGEAVTLPREQILVITTAEYDEYATHARLTRALSPAEEKELQRQRRLVKNRVYAQESRNKKKQIVVDVESKLELLQRENEQLKTELNRVNLENAALRNQVELLNKELRQQHRGSGNFTFLAVLFSFGLLFTLIGVAVPASSGNAVTRSLLGHESSGDAPLFVAFAGAVQSFVSNGVNAIATAFNYTTTPNAPFVDPGLLVVQDPCSHS